MLGLDAYGSSSGSDDDGAGADTHRKPPKAPSTPPAQPLRQNSRDEQSEDPIPLQSNLNGRPILDSQVEESITTAVPFPPSATSDADRLPDSSPLLGPAPAPTSALETSRPSTPPSPQTQIRNLTLPPFPNLSIPPSPPSSPNPATEAKIASLLALRRAGGPSLNDKLASSRAFANPGLFPQLLKAFGLDEEGAQHAGTLKAGGLDGTGVPEWMFKDGLEKLRREVWEEGERVKKGREKVEFVKERVKR